MSRNVWLVLVVIATGAALAATYVYERRPPATRAVTGPAPTAIGWAGRIDLVAGDGVAGLRDGGAMQARFADPYGVAVAKDGAVFVSDAGDNNRIRRIAPDGTVTTFAGSVEGFADGVGAVARHLFDEANRTVGWLDPLPIESPSAGGVSPDGSSE